MFMCLNWWWRHVHPISREFSDLCLNLNKILTSHIIIIVLIFLLLKLLFFLTMWEMKLDACLLVPLLYIYSCLLYFTHISLTHLSFSRLLILYSYLFYQHLRCCLGYLFLWAFEMASYYKSTPFLHNPSKHYITITWRDITIINLHLHSLSSSGHVMGSRAWMEEEEIQ